jgi:DNA-binding CsgD family transcriptional regulator
LQRSFGELLVIPRTLGGFGRSSSLDPALPASEFVLLFIAFKQSLHFAGGFRMKTRNYMAIGVNGLSTRELASKLFISKRTVDSHVANILNKLGLNSRIQLTRWVAGLPHQ